MATVREIYDFLDQKAPFSLQMDFDNAGFLVGHGEKAVTRIVVALDITEAVAEEAARVGAQLIVSHHPVIFHPVRRLTDDDLTGRLLLSLTERGIAAICAHTNLDVAEGGVNDALARSLELEDAVPFQPDGLGRVGLVSGPHTASLSAFASFVKERLGAGGVRCVDAGRPVRRVAVGGGACGDLVLAAAEAGCDTFITSDVKYNQFLDAAAAGINLIDAGHYPTENVVCPVLAHWLRQGFPEVEVLPSQAHREVFFYQ